MMEAIEAEKTVVLVELTEAQVKAVAKMNKDTEIDSIGRSVIASRIKGMYKAYKDGAEKGLALLYDDAARRGAKWEQTKNEFIRSEMTEINELFNRL